MKKITALLLAFALLLSLSPSFARAEQPLNVVCTIFPLYDWVRQIVGEDNDQVKVTLLMDKGTDLHNFQPTVMDMALLARCDLLLYVGGESDRWVDGTIRSAGTKAAFSLIDHVDAWEEELLPGMEEEHEHEEDEEEEEELDEHIWLSLKNAETLVRVIARELGELRPEAREEWEKNAEAYVEKLRGLEAEYAAFFEAAPLKTLLFADRFPFRYLAEDYGLTCYAAFSGCSAETEASFETVSFLVQTLRELQLPAVMVLEGSNGAIARTVIENAKANVPVLTLYSCQSVTAEQLRQGASYLKYMEENLQTLRQALGESR